MTNFLSSNWVKILKIFSLLTISICLYDCGGGGSSNSTPPTIATVSLDSSSGGIANGANNVDLNPLLVLKFSQPMVTSTINSDNIILSTTSDGANPVSLTSFLVNQATTKFSFSVAAPLQINKFYYLIVKNAQARDGSIIKGNFSFSTGSTSIPSVTMTNPENAAVGAWNTTTIQILFNQSVNNVNRANITLHSSESTGPEVLLAQITQNQQNSYTITPSSPLNYSTVYYLEFNSNITDNHGNKLVPTTYYFTTTRMPFLYITNYTLSTVIKCQLSTDGTPTNCVDSGAGNIFNYPYGIAPNYSNNRIYIASSSNNGLIECLINDADGSLYNCTPKDAFYAPSPFGVVVNQLKNVIYVSGVPYVYNPSVDLALSECFFRRDKGALDCYQTAVNSNGQITLNSGESTLYVTDLNDNGHIRKCSLDSYGLTSNGCTDTGFVMPNGNGTVFGLTLNNDNSVAYIALDNGDQNASLIITCQVDESGSFSNCLTALDNYDLGRLNGSSPGNIVINKYTQSIYFPSISTNNLLQCKTINGDYANLFCANNIALPGVVVNGRPGTTALTIRY